MFFKQQNNFFCRVLRTLIGNFYFIVWNDMNMNYLRFIFLIKINYKNVVYRFRFAISAWKRLMHSHILQSTISIYLKNNHKQIIYNKIRHAYSLKTRYAYVH